jgi:DNA-binding winged helix-turn-helix (wHTH) protein
MVMQTNTVEKSAPVKVRFGCFELDEAEARLLDDGKPVRLAPKPFAVLCMLARTPHALVAKSALLDGVWGHQYVTDSVLKTTISDLRAVLDDDPKQPRYIETVSRRGYRFIVAAVGAPGQRSCGVERTDAGGPGDPARTALTALCRGDAALADLIRMVAATLERERLASERAPVPGLAAS